MGTVVKILSGDHEWGMKDMFARILMLPSLYNGNHDIGPRDWGASFTAAIVCQCSR